MKPKRVYRDYLEDMLDALEKGAGFVEGMTFRAKRRD